MGRAWYIRQARGATCPHWMRRQRGWSGGADLAPAPKPIAPADAGQAPGQPVQAAARIIDDAFGVPEELRTEPGEPDGR